MARRTPDQREQRGKEEGLRCVERLGIRGRSYTHSRNSCNAAWNDYDTAFDTLNAAATPSDAYVCVFRIARVGRKEKR